MKRKTLRIRYLVLECLLESPENYYGMGGNRPGAPRPPRQDGSVEAAKAVLTYFRELAD